MDYWVSRKSAHHKVLQICGTEKGMGQFNSFSQRENGIKLNLVLACDPDWSLSRYLCGSELGWRICSDVDFRFATLIKHLVECKCKAPSGERDWIILEKTTNFILWLERSCLQAQVKVTNTIKIWTESADSDCGRKGLLHPIYEEPTMIRTILCLKMHVVWSLKGLLAQNCMIETKQILTLQLRTNNSQEIKSRKRKESRLLSANWSVFEFVVIFARAW